MKINSFVEIPNMRYKLLETNRYCLPLVPIQLMNRHRINTYDRQATLV